MSSQVSELSGLQDIIEGAAGRARQLSLEDVASKGRQDFVTNIDYRLDEWLTAAIEKRYPGVPVLSEERLDDDEHWPEGDFWIIDPLDGTHNKIADIPFHAIAIALCSGGRPVLSCVHDLAHNHTYAAAANIGAWRNGQQLRQKDDSSGLIAVSSGLLDHLVERPDLFHSLRALGKLRNFGAQSLHLSFVASGALSACLSREAKFWDDAAGRLIAEEAGASYFQFAERAMTGSEMRSVCAHPDLAGPLENLLTELWQ